MRRNKELGLGGGCEHAGFTLIELLVVIGIIAVLASLLLSAVSGSLRKSKQTNCLSNLKQIGVAMLSFAHDHNDAFPMQLGAGQEGSSAYDRTHLPAIRTLLMSPAHFQAISNELANTKVIACPSEKREPASAFWALEREQISYWVSAAAKPGVSTEYLAGDWNVSNAQTNSATRLLELEFDKQLHRYKGNVVYSDGHVELTHKLEVTEIPIRIEEPVIIAGSLNNPTAVGKTNGNNPATTEIGAADFFSALSKSIGDPSGSTKAQGQGQENKPTPADERLRKKEMESGRIVARNVTEQPVGGTMGRRESQTPAEAPGLVTLKPVYSGSSQTSSNKPSEDPVYAPRPAKRFPVLETIKWMFLLWLLLIVVLAAWLASKRLRAITGKLNKQSA